ncbi:MAG: hypothetical protein H8Z69_02665 [Nanohaloarchaea archaeon]|nr:hypothetical protein [Candidatus Nanohaloarchaea archaeon]
MTAILSRACDTLPKADEEAIKIEEINYDNLIILDACRYDLYQQVTGKKDYRISTGSSSRNVVKRNFSEGDWSDTVMITANPHFSDRLFEEITGRESDQVFHTVFKLFNTEWSEEEGTVLPRDMVDTALTAEKLFPGKKKIIWFMQPHCPFIPLESEELDNIEGLDSEENIWDKAERGKIGDEMLWTAYLNNLKYVMKEVDELIDKLEGRSVITSDHGNLVGESGLYGHPLGQETKVLRKVPFDVRDQN